MAAVIGMDVDVLQAICQEASHQSKAEQQAASTHVGEGEVIIANYNAPGQIVISGALRALEIASTLATERGAKRVIPLSVSGAFHSPVMAPAASKLADAIASIEMHNAQIPVISNITAAPLSSAKNLRHELAQQVASSVQWIRTIEYLQNAGVSIFLEIGPGKALAGMIKRIVKNVTILNINSIADIEKAATFVREAGLLTQ
jgi:[acyl-carrier-protein] S-malonyltransferase